MWLETIFSLLFASFISFGPASAQPFDCLPRGCVVHSDCPTSYPVCESSHCCRVPMFPPLCPREQRGPRCGLGYRSCRQGYTCRGGYCCRDVIQPSCPHYLRGPRCSRRYPPCHAGYTCRGRYCCRDVVFERCPGPNYVCPPIDIPPSCYSHADCPRGTRCCVVGCRPASCVAINQTVR